MGSEALNLALREGWRPRRPVLSNNVVDGGDAIPPAAVRKLRVHFFRFAFLLGFIGLVFFEGSGVV